MLHCHHSESQNGIPALTKPAEQSEHLNEHPAFTLTVRTPQCDTLFGGKWGVGTSTWAGCGVGQKFDVPSELNLSWGFCFWSAHVSLDFATP